MKCSEIFAFLTGVIAGAAVLKLVKSRQGEEFRHKMMEMAHKGMCSCAGGMMESCQMDQDKAPSDSEQ